MPLGYNNDDGAQALDQQQEIDFRRGWQVVDAASGSNLVTDGTGSYEVDVAAGDINTPTGTVTCSAATLDLQSLVVPDLPRIVIVYRDASGVAQTLAGTPAAKQPTGETAPGPIYQPAPDAFSTTDGVVLATVLLEAAASGVGAGQIRDRRMPASLNVDSAEVGSLSAENQVNELRVQSPRPRFWSKGDHFDSFEDLSNWTEQVGTRTADTSIVFKGDQSVKISGSSPRISNTVESPDITGLNPSIAVYADPQVTAQSDFEIVFYCPGFSDRITFTTQVDGSEGGWRRVEFGNVEVSGNPDFTDVSNILIRQFGDTTLWLDDFRFTERGDKGQVVLSFDDTLATHYTTAFPIMQKFGMPGVEGVITGNIGNSGFLTTAQINELKDTGGWDVISHSTDGTQLPTLSESEQRQRLEDSKKIIQQNGWDDHTFMYPGGGFDETALDAVTDYYEAAVTYSTGPGAALSNGITETAVIARGNADDLGKNQTIIDQAEQYNQTAILSFHAIGDANQTLNISEADFRSTIEYLAAADVDVITLTDLYKDIGLF